MAADGKASAAEGTGPAKALTGPKALGPAAAAETTAKVKAARRPRAEMK